MERTLVIEVKKTYVVKVDTENNAVKEYSSDQELAEHLADYNFGSGLPVVANGGVKITDSVVDEISIYQHKN